MDKYPYLSKILEPSDLQKLRPEELPAVAQEIRDRILEVVSQRGGHLAASLGVVELTLALYYLLNWKKDKVVWDTGHQAYPHKLLTGRFEDFSMLRQMEGISGFLKLSENPYDFFGAGHASTSISAALGMAMARDIALSAEAQKSGSGGEVKGQKSKAISQKEGAETPNSSLLTHHSKVVAIIGDAAMQGGMALEALNHAGHNKTDLLVILNDNDMSIGPATGAFTRYLNEVRLSSSYHHLKKEFENRMNRFPFWGKELNELLTNWKNSVKYATLLANRTGRVFEDLGFTYIGPINGHDIPFMLHILEKVLALKEPILLHVVTTKGKGYSPAETNPIKFHGLGKFDLMDGTPVKSGGAKTYTEVFGETLVRLAGKNEKIVAITASMPDGTGLLEYSQKFPQRYIDVGIAEEHAVTLAAGLSTQGFKPFVAIYSTFLQRAFDQIIHDVALQNLPVVFCIDRGGIVGQDGPTHHGVFDLSYLSMIPGMVVMAPRDENELRRMLVTAEQYPGPIAVRYPRGSGCGAEPLQELEPIEIGTHELIKKGDGLILIAAGRMVSVAEKAAELLEKEGISSALINARFIKPLDKKLILGQITGKTQGIITIEDNILKGGLGSSILELLQEAGISGVPVKRIGFPDKFVEHGEVQQLDRYYGLTPEGIVAKAKSLIKNPVSS